MGEYGRKYKARDGLGTRRIRSSRRVWESMGEKDMTRDGLGTERIWNDGERKERDRDGLGTRRIWNDRERKRKDWNGLYIRKGKGMMEMTGRTRDGKDRD